MFQFSSYFSRDRLHRWGLQGGFAIFDQGIFSGANFLMNILLARFLLPDDYGAYVIGLAVLVFFLQVLTSYMLEPMGVLGPSYHGKAIKEYLATQFHLYLRIITPLGLLLAGLAYFYESFSGNNRVCRILVAIGLLLPLLLLPWLMRRMFLILGRPEISARGSAVYALALIVILYFGNHLGVLTGVSTVFVVSLAGLSSGLFLLGQFGWQMIFRNGPPLGDALLQNWKFGKWLVASGLLLTISSQAYIFLAGNVLSLKDAGVVYALQSLAQPMTLSVTAIGALVTPKLAADYANGEYRSFRTKAVLMTIALTGAALLFELLLLLFRSPIEQTLFGGKFSAYSNLIPIWGLIPLVMAAVSGVNFSLQAARRQYALLIACLFWLPVSAGLGFIMIQSSGLSGLAWSTVAGYLVLASVLAILYSRWLLRPVIPPMAG